MPQVKKRLFTLITSVLMVVITHAQRIKEAERIEQLEKRLEAIATDIPGLCKKVDISISRVVITEFLRGIANAHKLNITTGGNLSELLISGNFSDTTVADLLLFLCKEHRLTIEDTGNILVVKNYNAPAIKHPPKKRIITYDAKKDLFNIDVKQDSLYPVFKKITDVTGKNMVFSPGMAALPVNAYIRQMPLEGALKKIAYANNLTMTKTGDDYYLFAEKESKSQVFTQKKGVPTKQRAARRLRHSDFFFRLKNKAAKTVDVHFENAPIADVLYKTGMELGLNLFLTDPLSEAGNITIKANDINFDVMLYHILENTDFTFKKTDSLYILGKKKQASLTNEAVVTLKHRSIEVLSDGRSKGNTKKNMPFGNKQNSLDKRLTTNNLNTTNSAAATNQVEDFLKIIPTAIVKDLEIKTDIERNSFIVSGPEGAIKRFRTFIETIDKPVAVVLIEVMLIEINKSTLVESGIDWGVGGKNTETSGSIFPGVNMKLGSKVANEILNSFNGFRTLNIGTLIPDFFMGIKALESNGVVKIHSTPRLATLNGHRASLSIGETTYYAVTSSNFYGSQIPQASEIKNYQPISAKLAIDIRPLVSGDGYITMDIRVLQSRFSEARIAEDAPPGINSREFNSLIRVKNKDLIILGGLEDKTKSNSGKGLPLLSRIPIIKWFFSSRKKEDNERKLSVLIKPTVIQ